MSIVRTSMRETRERAENLRFYPTGTIVATNVQDAIEEVALESGPGNTVEVSVGMSPYTPGANDTTLLVDTSGGAVTILLPLAADRERDVEVKDVTGDAVANPITVATTGGETIDELASYPIDSAFGAAKFGSKPGGYYVHA